MKDDKQLQKDVLAELEWAPSVKAAHIGVAVENGIVTLSGHVSSFMEKHAAEVATRRVKGVHAIVQEVEVKLPSSAERSDADIAASILNTFRWTAGLPFDRLKVEVEKGQVAVYGDVDWQYQKDLAERNARAILGVRSVLNNIAIKPSVKPFEVKQKIEQALKRNAELEASHIEVTSSDTTVTLSGRVHTWYERDAVEEAAWSAPGVIKVVDNIRVEA